MFNMSLKMTMWKSQSIPTGSNIYTYTSIAPQSDTFGNQQQTSVGLITFLAELDFLQIGWFSDTNQVFKWSPQISISFEVLAFTRLFQKLNVRLLYPF